jgi:hypothetical protein
MSNFLPLHGNKDMSAEAEARTAGPPAASDVYDSYGETVAQMTDIDSWEAGYDITAFLERMRREIETSVRVQARHASTIRERVLPLLKRANAPEQAGLYQVTPEDIVAVQQKVLFNGAAEATDGTRISYETLPVVVAQIGVCLVSYKGDVHSFAHRTFRRDVRFETGDAFEDALAILENRSRRGEAEESGDLSRILTRGLMGYGERAVLAYKAGAPWRIGHGSPVPVELVSNAELAERSLPMLERLLLTHKKFVFVPSETTAYEWLTVGYALHPGEYAVLETMERRLQGMLETLTTMPAPLLGALRAFLREAGSRLLVGVYRASRTAPPRLFYAHEDHVHQAALVALADSTLQEHRGFPLLIDLADRLCRSSFGNDVFHGAVENAYACVDAPYSFLGERQTRS